MFYGYRIEDIAKRRRFFELFIAEFRAIVDFMASEIEKLFDELDAVARRSSQLRLAASGS